MQFTEQRGAITSIFNRSFVNLHEIIFPRDILANQQLPYVRW